MNRAPRSNDVLVEILREILVALLVDADVDEDPLAAVLDRAALLVADTPGAILPRGAVRGILLDRLITPDTPWEAWDPDDGGGRPNDPHPET